MINTTNDKIIQDWDVYRGNGGVSYGKHSMVIISPELCKSDFGIDVDNACIRIFKNDNWEGTPIDEVIKIQNVFAAHGIAPKILDKISISGSKSFSGVLMEYVPKKRRRDWSMAMNQIYEIMAKYAIVPYLGKYHNEFHYNTRNWHGNVYLDYGGFRIHAERRFVNEVIKEIADVTHFGKSYNGGKASYQSIKDWDVDGKRKTEYRIETMELDKINFENESVLDLGCNLGLMLHYAQDRGATRLVGYDTPEVARVANLYAAAVGRLGLNVQGLDLAKKHPSEKFDIVFYLAMSKYLGFPKWLGEITKKLCIYEGHANDDWRETEARRVSIFDEIEFVGTTYDRSERLVYWCYNK